MSAVAKKIDLMTRMYKLKNTQTKHTIECLNMDWYKKWTVASERMQEVLNGAEEMIHVKVVKANRFAWVRAEKIEASGAFVWGSPH